MQQTENPLSGTGGVTTTYLMYLASGLTQVLDDGTTTYTYGIDRISQTTGTDTEYFLDDALGSVRQLADAGGAIRLDRNYDPFGNVDASAGSGSSMFDPPVAKEVRFSFFFNPLTLHPLPIRLA